MYLHVFTYYDHFLELHHQKVTSKSILSKIIFPSNKIPTKVKIKALFRLPTYRVHNKTKTKTLIIVKSIYSSLHSESKINMNLKMKKPFEVWMKLFKPITTLINILYNMYRGIQLFNDIGTELY